MLGLVLFWVGLALVVVPYGGYALWVAARARLFPRPCRAAYAADPDLPAVTCVLAAHDEEAVVGRKLDALAAQDYPQDKVSVLVVSDGSEDRTDAIVAGRAAENSRVRLLRTARRSGKPTALNLARRHVETPLAVFMDVRQGLTPDALRELVAHLADPAVGVVSGTYRAEGDAYWVYEGFVRRSESRSGSMTQVTGSLYALRTPDLPELPPDTILDDVYVPLTVAIAGGRRIVLAERAGSLDVVTRSVGSEFVRKVRTLAGLLQICGTVPGCLDPRRNPVWGRFVMHKLGRLAGPYGLLLALAGASAAPGWPYRLALAGGLGALALALAGHLGLRARLARLCTSFVALNAAALWAVPAYYLGRVSVTWARVETDRT
jgi:poly-beta-1,6-N-acetyl-D-glucosamine synthase